MTDYTQPILNAILIFPFIAILFTIPYVLYQYHKYGSIPIIRVLIVYSFILYLTCSYFLVILPLPKREDVLLLTTPRYQLIPFLFARNIINNPNLIYNQPYTYQLFYNILLTIPFGIYLRYYYECSLKKTFIFSFLLSLFFELTQLSGLYGIYPRGYRLFDVDDLILNTFGGLLGYYASGVLTFLPSRDKIDEISYKRGSEVSGGRRIVTFLLDLILFFIFGISSSIIGYKIYPIHPIYYFIICLFIYYSVIPIFTSGQTPVKRFLNIKLEGINNKKIKWWKYFIRTLFLFFVLLGLPFYVILLFGFLLNYLPNSEYYRYFLLGGFCFTELFVLFYYFICIVRLFQKKALLHEKVSGTNIVSTIVWNEEKIEDTKEKIDLGN